MPVFNYENPVNISGASPESPEDLLLKRILEVLVYEGYPALSAAKLLKRGADLTPAGGTHRREQIAFWALCETAERIRIAYEEVTAEAAAYLENRKYNKEESLRLLEQLLWRHISLCLHPQNRIYVLAVCGEYQLPEQLSEILPKACEKYFLNILTGMILAVAEVKKPAQAAMIAAEVCAGINGFVQQPKLCREIFRESTRREPNYAVLEDELNNYFLRSIKANTAINKEF